MPATTIQKMVGKLPPQPEAAKKKAERDAKVSAALQQLREKRRADNKAKREAAAKRAHEQEVAHEKSVRAEIDARRSVHLLKVRQS